MCLFEWEREREREMVQRMIPTLKKFSSAKLVNERLSERWTRRLNIERWKAKFSRLKSFEKK